MIIRLIAGLIKRWYIKMSQYFPKLYEAFRGDINVKVDLSNYVTKTNLKDATGLIRLNKLQNTEVDKVDIDKFKSAPI